MEYLWKNLKFAFMCRVEIFFWVYISLRLTSWSFFASFSKTPQFFFQVRLDFQDKKSIENTFVPI